MSIKITSDSTSDLSPALLEQYDITVLPLYVTMGEQTCQDGVDACRRICSPMWSAPDPCPPQRR